MHLLPLGNVVHKGIRTFDHLKMQREEEARNRDFKTRSVQANDIQVRPAHQIALSVYYLFNTVLINLVFIFILS